MTAARIIVEALGMLGIALALGSIVAVCTAGLY